MFNGKGKKINKYTSIFPYADKYSVMSLSEKDLQISHKYDIAGKDNKVAKPHYGEEVLVVAKKKDGVHVFVAQIGKYVDDDRNTVWHRNGGNMWKFNYEISNKTEVTYLTNEQICEITGCETNEARKIWVDQLRGPKWGGFRDSVKNYLKKSNK